MVKSRVRKLIRITKTEKDLLDSFLAGDSFEVDHDLFCSPAFRAWEKRQNKNGRTVECISILNTSGNKVVLLRRDWLA